MKIPVFKQHQRIMVLNGPLAGRTGVVVRLRRKDDKVWVDMDLPLEAPYAKFPQGDPRQDLILLSPQDCQVSEPILRF